MLKLLLFPLQIGGQIKHSCHYTFLVEQQKAVAIINSVITPKIQKHEQRVAGEIIWSPVARIILSLAAERERLNRERIKMEIGNYRWGD